MKRLFMLLMVVYTTSSIAAELKPFIGTGGQFQFMLLYNTLSNGDPRDYSDIYPLLEPYIEIGCEIGKWEVYGTHEFIEPESNLWGYSSAIDTITLTSESEYQSERWNNERYCLGVRYRGYDDPVRPLIGIGLEVGRFVQSNRDARYRDYYEIEEFEWDTLTYQYYNWVSSRLLYDHRDRWKSAMNIGGVVEFGVGLSPINALEVICVTRIHGAFANFAGSDFWFYSRDYSIVSPAFLIQLRYAPFTFKL